MERSISDIVLSPKDIAYIRLLMSELRSDELRKILEGINQNKFGPSYIVKKRILDLFNGPRTTLMQELEQQVLLIHLSKQSEMQQPQHGRIKRIKKLLQKYQQNSIETTNQTIRFSHNLPFFRTIHSLLKPIHCQGNNISTFRLTKLRKIKDIPNYIEKSWDSERKEYKIQIVLRLEQVGHTTIVNGRLPSNIHVSVNNYDCKLPKLIFPETGDPTPWRLNVPIDITKQINLKKNKRNTLKITYSNDPHTYVAGVFLSEKLTSEDLLKKIKKKRYLRRSDVTKEFIKNSLKNNDDMSVDSFIVSLKDPLTTQRMKVPARGKECKHLQCFDAKKFLQMNEQTQKWECPICKEQVKYENIEIDEFFYRILQSSKLSKGSENIILLNDGTWTESKPMYTSLNNKEIISIDSDENNINGNFDNEEIEPKSKRFKYNPPEVKKSKHIAETVEVIKTNVISSTKCDIIKNGFTPSASDNSIIMLNGIPGPSSIIESNCILNNFNLPNNTNSVNIHDSLESKGKNIQKKVKSVLCVITLD